MPLRLPPLLLLLLGTLGLPAHADAAPPALRKALVAAHNQARQRARPTPRPALPPLTWSASAARVAEGWARRCEFEHNPERGTFGENLYATTDANTSAHEVVDSWAGEARDYDHASNTCARGKVCGHYTQLVWRTTTQVGCAVQRCTRNAPFRGVGTWYLWVCDYAPPGNVMGRKPY